MRDLKSPVPSHPALVFAGRRPAAPVRVTAVLPAVVGEGRISPPPKAEPAVPTRAQRSTHLSRSRRAAARHTQPRFRRALVSEIPTENHYHYVKLRQARRFRPRD
jgi:hypothetical protein